MNLSEVMDDVATALRTIGDFREVAEYPKGSVTPPAGVVSYPDSYKPHATYARGSWEIKALPVIVVVGKASERAAREKLSGFLQTIITTLESGAYTAFDSLTVSNVDFDVVKIGETDYIAALLDCDIVGSGK